MPSTSPKQARLMAGVAHGTIKGSGVPQAVAKEFNQADAKTGILRKKKKGGKDPNFAKEKEY